MEACDVYPQWPPVPVMIGLAGSVSVNHPSCIPYQPRTISDCINNFGIDCLGVPLQLHRNITGYPYLYFEQKRRRYVRLRQSDRPEISKEHILTSSRAECAFYRSKYRQYIPHDLLLQHLIDDKNQEAELHSSYQGNALTGALLSDPTYSSKFCQHAIFIPTGEVLQKAQLVIHDIPAMYQQSSPISSLRKSNAIETGTSIRQLCIMGSSNYLPAKRYIIARGAAQATIIAASNLLNVNEKCPQLDHVTQLHFSDMLTHIATSPHTEAECAFITKDGSLFHWEPISGLYSFMRSSDVGVQLERCEYSSHPCVLWAADSRIVSSIDLREPTVTSLRSWSFCDNRIQDISNISSDSARIYEIKRRSGNPFHLATASNVAIELIDSRMRKQPLLSWAHDVANTFSGLSLTGWLEDLEIPSRSNEYILQSGDGGAIVSVINKSKHLSIYPFQLGNCPASSNITQNQALLLAPIIANDSSESDAWGKRISQFVASDPVLNVHLPDSSDETVLHGSCTLVNEFPCTDDHPKGFSTMYYINSLGDLFAQTLSARKQDIETYQSAVQLNLPCGVTLQADKHTNNSWDQEPAYTLPLKPSSLLIEHDAVSLKSFSALPIKHLIDKQIEQKSNGPSSSFNENNTKSISIVAQKLCNPSISFSALYDAINDQGYTISIHKLLQIIQSEPNKFIIQNAAAASTRRQVIRVVNNQQKSFSSDVSNAELQPNTKEAECCCDSLFNGQKLSIIAHNSILCASPTCIVASALIVRPVMNHGSQIIQSVIPLVWRNKIKEASSPFTEVVQKAKEKYKRDQP